MAVSGLPVFSRSISLAAFKKKKEKKETKKARRRLLHFDFHVFFFSEGPWDAEQPALACFRPAYIYDLKDTEFSALINRPRWESSFSLESHSMRSLLRTRPSFSCFPLQQFLFKSFKDHSQIGELWVSTGMIWKRIGKAASVSAANTEECFCFVFFFSHFSTMLLVFLVLKVHSTLRLTSCVSVLVSQFEHVRPRGPRFTNLIFNLTAFGRIYPNLVRTGHQQVAQQVR